ncbi:tetratricopeptide repeat protein [Shigella flexneri]
MGNNNIQAAGRPPANAGAGPANRLRDSGKEQEGRKRCFASCRPNPYRPDAGGRAEQRGDHEAAKTAYNTVLQRERQNEDAILGLTEVYLAQGNKDAARKALAAAARGTENGEPLSIRCSARLAMAQAGLGILLRQKRPSTRPSRRPNRSHLRWKVRW